MENIAFNTTLLVNEAFKMSIGRDFGMNCGEIVDVEDVLNEKAREFRITIDPKGEGNDKVFFLVRIQA
jgi:hypothetical protein